jgi:hypothetical protein
MFSSLSLPKQLSEVLNILFNLWIFLSVDNLKVKLAKPFYGNYFANQSTLSLWREISLMLALLALYWKRKSNGRFEFLSVYLGAWLIFIGTFRTFFFVAFTKFSELFNFYRNPSTGVFFLGLVTICPLLSTSMFLILRRAHIMMTKKAKTQKNFQHFLITTSFFFCCAFFLLVKRTLLFSFTSQFSVWTCFNCLGYLSLTGVLFELKHKSKNE